MYYIDNSRQPVIFQYSINIGPCSCCIAIVRVFPLHTKTSGQIFFLPQYCQSVLERALWPEYLSLWQEPWQWSGDPDATAALEARLPYLLNTFLAGEYGWEDAYFSTYKD